MKSTPYNLSNNTSYTPPRGLLFPVFCALVCSPPVLKMRSLNLVGEAGERAVGTPAA